MGRIVVVPADVRLRTTGISQLASAGASDTTIGKVCSRSCLTHGTLEHCGNVARGTLSDVSLAAQLCHQNLILKLIRWEASTELIGQQGQVG